MDSLLDHGSPSNRRRLWIFDDFLDSPVLALGSGGGSKTLTAAETPSSIFVAIPFALQHGYKYFSLGHERSADTGQKSCEKTGEDINHQWGKSLEAEVLISDYVKEHLVSNLTYFSILKPIYDVLIFNLLREDLDAVRDTHSCNEAKPWCKKCPKCAYVWLNYMAWLPEEVVDEIFEGTNLFDIEENQETFMQLVGVTDQLPFECIGQADESRLAFEMCHKKDLKGKAMDSYLELNLNVNIEETLEKYLIIDTPANHFPNEIFDFILPQLENNLKASQEYVERYANDQQ